MSYEELQIQYDNLNIQEMDLSEIKGLKGLCFNGNIAIDKSVSQIEKVCVLAEELGHYHTSVGDILDLTDVGNRKQEYRARLWGYNKQIGLSGIIQGFKAHCRNRNELAEHLNVTEVFLQEALDCYRSKYGIFAEMDNYVIIFEPSLSVMEKM